MIKMDVDVECFTVVTVYMDLSEKTFYKSMNRTVVNMEPSVLNYRMKTMLHSISKIIINNSKYHLLSMLILKASQPRSTQFPQIQLNHLPRNTSTITLLDFRMLSCHRQKNTANLLSFTVVRTRWVSFSSV